MPMAIHSPCFPWASTILDELEFINSINCGFTVVYVNLKAKLYNTTKLARMLAAAFEKRKLNFFSFFPLPPLSLTWFYPLSCT